MTKKLEPRILTLRKLVDGTATYSWSDPYLNGVDLLLDRRDFHALDLAGYVRITIEAVTAEDVQEEQKEDPAWEGK